MYVVYESGVNGAPTVISRHNTFEEAMRVLENNAACVCCGPDEDNPGCADAIMADGRILCIEPAARRHL